MQFLILILFALSAAATIILSPIPESTLRRRDSDLAALLAPQSSVSISYGSPNTDHIARAQITALPGHPIVLLDRLPTHKVWANDLNVLVVFTSVSDAENALMAWEGRDGIVAIQESSEEAFIVKGIEIEDFVIRLWTDRLDWGDAFSSMRMEIGYEEEDSAPELRRRAENNSTSDNVDGNEVDSTLNLAVGSPTDRIQLWPKALVSREVTTDFQIHCVGCRTQGKARVHAALDIDSTWFKRRKQKRDIEFNPLEVQTAFFEITIVEDFKAFANLEFSGGVTHTETFKKSVLGDPIVLSQMKLGKFIEIGPRIDLEVEFKFKTGVAQANFTYGAEITVPKGALARLDYANKQSSKATGWNQSTVEEIPFHFNQVDVGYSFEVNATARPKLHLGIYSADLDNDKKETASIGAGLSLDMPTFYAKGSVVDDVGITSCEPRGDKDYTYFSSAIKVDTGVSVAVVFAAESTTDIDILPKALEEVLNKSWDYDLFRMELANDTLCLGLDKASGSTGAETAKKIDVAKVETAVEKDGKLPSGVSKEALASQTATGEALPSGVEALVAEGVAVRGVAAMCSIVMAAISAGVWLVL